MCNLNAKHGEAFEAVKGSTHIMELAWVGNFSFCHQLGKIYDAARNRY